MTPPKFIYIHTVEGFARFGILWVLVIFAITILLLVILYLNSPLGSFKSSLIPFTESLFTANSKCANPIPLWDNLETMLAEATFSTTSTLSCFRSMIWLARYDMFTILLPSTEPLPASRWWSASPSERVRGHIIRKQLWFRVRVCMVR